MANKPRTPTTGDADAVYMPDNIRVAMLAALGGKLNSDGGDSGGVVAEIFTSGTQLNKGIENLAAGSSDTRFWAAGNRPKMVIIEAKPSDPTTTEIVRANARVNLVFDAATAAIGEAMAVPQNTAATLPYEEISLNKPIQKFFPKTDTYDGLSSLSVYSNGVAVDIVITAVK